LNFAKELAAVAKPPLPSEGEGWGEGLSPFRNSLFTPGPARPRGTRPRPGARRGAAGGFTLLEIMVAMSIFVVGFLALGAMLPVAVVEQRRTMDELNTQELARTAVTEMRSRTLTMSSNLVNIPDLYLDDPFQSNGPVNKPLWSATNCSYPSSIADPNDRRFFWYPMVRRTVDPPANTTAYDWQALIFIVRRDFAGYTPTNPPSSILLPAMQTGPLSLPVLNTTWSSVTGLGRFNLKGTPNKLPNPLTPQYARPISPGDLIADCLGGVYRVAAADDSSIYVPGPIPPTPSSTNTVFYYPPAIAGKPSPLMRIVTVTDLLVVP
jgi:prepilin-type N-terminal cleavage/methylation domain-containing protein